MRSILIVDDEEYVRKFVAATLRKQDFQILHADSADQALSMARENVPDLILLDLVLPGKRDGMAVAAQLKADPITAKCPVILMSGKAKALPPSQTDIDGFLSKPFKPKDLRNIIATALGAA